MLPRQIQSLMRCLSLIIWFCLALVTTTAVAQTPSFTYQGRLTDGGTAANGTYDMQFKLFDSPTVGSGNQIGATITSAAVNVSGGVFTVQLDYGATAFPGADRYLEIGMRPAGSPDPYTVLSPRQQIASTPYAIRAGTASVADTANSATNATNATQLGGVNASQFVLTGDARLSDSRPPTPGSAAYIQNTTSQQANASFSIGGDGTAQGTLRAPFIRADTQYNIGVNRVFSIPGTANTFVGPGTGLSSTGDNNSFTGAFAGSANTTGSNNAFFGAFAGFSNSEGSENAFFGVNAGRASSQQTGQNSFFGTNAGMNNTTGTENAFFGYEAGKKNKAGLNAFFGYHAGFNDNNGERNSFFGADAGQGVISGSQNSFMGDGTGSSVVSADNNSFFGAHAGLISSGSGNTFIGANSARFFVDGNNNTALGYNIDVYDGISHATAIGADAYVFHSNEIVLGTDADSVRAAGFMLVQHLQMGGNVPICTGGGADLALAFCSSSLRYKKDLHPFTRGLALLNQLKPLTFKWKADNSPDLGFGAEDVAKVEPLLVTYNDKGEIEGVKYDRITAVLVNAVKEQQTQIERQQREITKLKQLVCARRRRTAVCQ